MTGRPLENLRDALRRITRPDHDRVDAVFAGLDLTTAADCARFFTAHHAAYQTLSNLGVPDTAAVCSALDADLLALGAAPAEPCAGLPHRPHATAARYVLMGSQLGTRMLRRTWAQSTDPRVAAAGTYFAGTLPAGAWTAFCRDLAALPADTRTARIIIADTQKLFALFVRAGMDATHKGQPHHA